MPTPVGDHCLQSIPGDLANRSASSEVLAPFLHRPHASTGPAQFCFRLRMRVRHSIIACLSSLASIVPLPSRSSLSNSARYSSIIASSLLHNRNRPKYRQFRACRRRSLKGRAERECRCGAELSLRCWTLRTIQARATTRMAPRAPTIAEMYLVATVVLAIGLPSIWSDGSGSSPGGARPPGISCPTAAHVPL